MTKANLNNEREQVIFGDDSIVIQKYISGVKGGRTLDVTGFTDKVIKASHVIIHKDGVYKPMPVAGGSYAALPEGYSYAGVLYRSIMTAKPFASIMTWGEVNDVAKAYDMSAILADFKAACPHIDFIKDEEA
ncbi:MAG: hypothetical protein LUI85_02585 [Bacteroides sp.]|nr:hypothetical protein [Bacteroides sp.]